MKKTVLLNPDHLERWDIDRLHALACWLEGIKLGSGGALNPLGTATIDSLWKTIRTLNGGFIDNPDFNPRGIFDSPTPQRKEQER